LAGPLDPAAALSAFARADFDYTRALASVWRDSADHVPDLNGDVVRLLARELADRTGRQDANPLGRVVLGRTGAGKTHLLGALRREVWQRGGWFVLMDLMQQGEFWPLAAHCYVAALGQPMLAQRSQGEVLLDRLRDVRQGNGAPGNRGTLARWAAWVWTGQPGVATMLGRLDRLDAAGARSHRAVAIAFLQMTAGDEAVRDAARFWLLGTPLPPADLARIGVRAMASPRQVVEGLSWLMALAGPTVCAIDQLDALVGVSHQAAIGGEGGLPAALAIGSLAGGLMALRDVTRRTMTVLSALPVTWRIMEERAVTSFPARFHPPLRLQQISSAHTARQIVEGRLARGYRAAGFVPPYPGWPFRPEAFDSAASLSPRELLEACLAHQARCRQDGAVTELASFARPPAEPAETESAAAATPPTASEGIGARFAILQAAATDEPGSAGDARPGSLVRSGLQAWLRTATPPAGRQVVLDGDVPGLHARLRVIDTGSGAERHLCFAAITGGSPVSVQNRLNAALQAAAIAPVAPHRLIVVRREFWGGGAKTIEVVTRFEQGGGTRMWPNEAEWRRLAALHTLLTEAPDGLDAWLRAVPATERPALFAILDRFVGQPSPAPPPAQPPEPAPGPAPLPTPVQPPTPRPAPQAAAIPLGVRTGDRQPVLLPLPLLPRHIAVVAGAGSGKTVFLRRLIEEAALAGIPSIVLDSGNDMVRLAEPWPDDRLDAADRIKAERYLREAEVVIWTPGRSRGNPLTLAYLPDFAALADDPDARDQALQMAEDALGSLVATTGAQGRLRAGVLADALRQFAAAGGGGLDAFVALLRDLPADASRIDRAPRLAGDIANELLAAQARNPLLAGEGPPLDAALLLGAPGGRTRVSVVNLAGLPHDAARQDFVARLLMGLFGHIRRHPATAERPVLGLLVMDEAQTLAPSVTKSPSRTAAAALAGQARKYGLGMVFATQTPRAVDNAIIANCTTQLFGRCNAPAAIETVREMLASRGGAADDLGRLETGTFYLTTEGLPRPQKIRTPLCLTNHPASPPSEEEVLTRAATLRGKAVE
jgi:predicted ATPase